MRASSKGACLRRLAVVVTVVRLVHRGPLLAQKGLSQEYLLSKLASIEAAFINC